MPETASREIQLLGEPVSYEVRYSDEASEPRIDVDIRNVTVVLPTEAEEDPEHLLKENAAWVVEKKQKYDAYREQAPEREFEEAATFPYLGEQHEIVIEQRSSSDVGEETLRLAEHHVNQTSVKRALESLYRRKARELFEDRATTYAAEMGVEYDTIELRNQRTRWGSCSSTGTLSLNWRLIMAPIDIVDYLIIHELAHLRESNHTDAFWSLVREYDPEFQTHARWLDENSSKLIFSREDL